MQYRVQPCTFTSIKIFCSLKIRIQLICKSRQSVAVVRLICCEVENYWLIVVRGAVPFILNHLLIAEEMYFVAIWRQADSNPELRVLGYNDNVGPLWVPFVAVVLVDMLFHYCR